MRSVFRVILTIAFSVISCGLAFIGLLVARDVWLLLGQLLLPNYALFSLADKALVIIAGIVGLALIIYSLESYADIQIPSRLWQKFLQVTALQIWFLGICHAILSIIEHRIGIVSSSAFVLPTAEILVGTGLYFLQRRCIGNGLAKTQI